MTRVEVSTVIDAPPRVVYDYVDDHDYYPQYWHGFKNFEATSKRHEVGTRLKMEGMALGIRLPMELETTEVVPEHRIAFRFISGMKGQGEWTFMPAGVGTKVTCITDYELPMGVLGQIADRAVVERDIRANLEKTLASLQQKAEAR
ncbi:MAG: SRPBCC family protein [Dehalococcoidales bacterium]|nr:SRPBCC family protein [Dehalococcoidales bacterium]